MSFNKISSISRLRNTAGKASAIAAAISTVALCVAAPAHAQTDAVQTKVNYQDLDLARDQDVKRLYTRLQQASKAVCASQDGRALQQHIQFKQCYGEALATAVNEVNAAQLTRLHDSLDTMKVAQQRKPENAS